MRAAIIPARGGSQRIPRKNLRLFHGKPIIAYAIETAKASGLFDDGIWISSEDPEIQFLSTRYEVGLIKRPPELAEVDGAPDCGTQEVTRHALGALEREGLKPQYVCCIYATAVLMTARDLRMGWRVIERNAKCAIAYGCGGEPFKDAGAFYWYRAQALIDRVVRDPYAGNFWKIAIDRERVCDINTEEDWARAEKQWATLKAQGLL